MVVINIPSVWLCVTTMEQKIVPHVKKWVIFRKQNKTIDILMNLMVSFLNTSVQYQRILVIDILKKNPKTQKF